MKVETDAIALMAVLAGVIAGAVVYVLLFRLRLEDGLRKRRSPNQVRLEAAAGALAIAAAIACFATLNLLIFLGLFAVAVLLLLAGRGFGILTLVAIGLALAMGLLAAKLKDHHHPEIIPSQAPSAKPPAAGAKPPIPLEIDHPASASSAATAEEPTPLVKSASAPAHP